MLTKRKFQLTKWWFMPLLLPDEVHSADISVVLIQNQQ